MPYNVGTSTELEATYISPQRRLFYAKGLYWLFWWDGSNIVYSTSPDGITWATPTIIRSNDQPYTFDVYYSNLYPDYVYFVYCRGLKFSALEFTRGTLNPDGTITWGTTYTVAPASLILVYPHPVVCVLDDGRPMVGANRGTGLGGSNRWTVWINPLNDGSGTWTYTLVSDAVSADLWRGSVSALTSAKAYSCYGIAGYALYGKLFEADAWGTEVVVDPDAVYWSYSITPENDNLHLAYYHGLYPLYRKYTYGVGWSAEEVTSDRTCDGVAISIDVNGRVYIFCNHVYRNEIFYVHGFSGAWEPATIVSDIETDARGINCPLVANDYIGFCWSIGAEPNITIRFEKIPIIVIIVIPRLTGDGLTQVVYVSP